MGANEEILRKTQFGFEGTRGTGVATTRLMYCQITPSFERPIREFTDTSGTFDARRRVTYQRQRVTFAMTDLLTFEDLGWWYQMGVKGGVTATSDAGTPAAYPYNFTGSSATDDLKAATVEWNHLGNVYKTTQVMMNSFTIRIDPDNEGGWIMDAEMMGRDLVTSSYTAGPADRTTEVIKAPGTTLHIDDATIGTTLVTGKFISASVTANNNIHFKAFAEDETSFAANKVGRGARTYNAQFVLEFDDDVEFAKFRSTTPVARYVQLKSLGSLIHDTPDTFKAAQIQLFGYWESISWGNREGNIIATFGLSAFYDPTFAAAAKFSVVNKLTTELTA